MTINFAINLVHSDVVTIYMLYHLENHCSTSKRWSQLGRKSASHLPLNTQTYGPSILNSRIHTHSIDLKIGCTIKILPCNEGRSIQSAPSCKISKEYVGFWLKANTAFENPRMTKIGDFPNLYLLTEPVSAGSGCMVNHSDWDGRRYYWVRESNALVWVIDLLAALLCNVQLWTILCQYCTRFLDACFRNIESHERKHPVSSSA